MRFTVATAVLARSFLHAAAFTEDEQQFANKVSHAGEREKMQILLEKKPSPLGPGQQQRAMQHQRKVAALKRKAQERVKPLTNLRQAKKEFTECDPNALDLGVLACGSDEFCMENQSSSKGGFCSSRPLEYYDDDDYDDDYDDAFDDGIGFDDDYDDGGAAGAGGADPRCLGPLGPSAGGPCPLGHVGLRGSGAGHRPARRGGRSQAPWLPSLRDTWLNLHKAQGQGEVLSQG